MKFDHHKDVNNISPREARTGSYLESGRKIAKRLADLKVD
jgi:hypothetical protein